MDSVDSVVRYGLFFPIVTRKLTETTRYGPSQNPISREVTNEDLEADYALVADGDGSPSAPAAPEGNPSENVVNRQDDESPFDDQFEAIPDPTTEQGAADAAPTPIAEPERIPTPPLTPPPKRTIDSERFDIVCNLMSRPKQSGETWYIVSLPWWNRWEKAVENSNKHALPGPVDNGHLVDRARGQLANDLMLGRDITFVPHDAWNQLLDWYVPLLRLLILRIETNDYCLGMVHASTLFPDK